jgi:hypothetical protein
MQLVGIWRLGVVLLVTMLKTFCIELKGFTLLYKKALCNPFSFSVESQQACRVQCRWKPGQAQKIYDDVSLWQRLYASFIRILSQPRSPPLLGRRRRPDDNAEVEDKPRRQPLPAHLVLWLRYQRNDDAWVECAKSLILIV